MRPDSFFYIWIGVVFFCLFFCIFVTQQSFHSPARLIMCDVGQGDAFLLVDGSFQMLIDGGPPNAAIERCLRRHIPIWDKTIEVLVATHPDDDHIGGLPLVFSQYSVILTLISPVTKETTSFSTFSEALLEEKKQGMTLIYPKQGDFFQFSKNISGVILSPELKEVTCPKDDLFQSETLLWDECFTFDKKNGKEKDYNDLSIGILLTVNTTKIAMMADLSIQKETAIMKTGLINTVDVLKVGHHGSKTSSSREFVLQIRPEISLISCGKNNRFGHPHNEILQLFEDLGIKTVRTDENGEVEVVLQKNGVFFLKP